MMDKLELECEKCGKKVLYETGKGFMIGGKFYCWSCASNELKMEGRKE